MILKLILIITMASSTASRIILPSVSNTPHPPVPDIMRSDFEDTEEFLDDDEDPEVSPGLFQGDMAMTEQSYKHWRIGIRWDVFPERLWPNRTVPYAISLLYEPPEYATIYQALKTISVMTCVKFVPWNGKTKDYLLIWPIKYPRGCWSFVGRYGGAQIVSLQPPDARGSRCLGSEGRALHELMHALGLFHEQSRADRDKFVKIHRDNIIPKYLHNFEKQSLKNTSYAFEYDYDSIMHYGSGYFSRSRDTPTITTKHAGVKIGQRRGLSQTDCLKINHLYGCLDRKGSAKMYYAICNALGV